jgi:hypothetical protein
VSERNESGKGSHFWNCLSQAGLTEVNPEDISSRIQTTRRAVIQRLHELLEERNQPVECESAASVLGTLTELGRRVRKEEERPGSGIKSSRPNKPPEITR